MKKQYIVILSIIFVVGGLLLVLKFSSPTDPITNEECGNNEEDPNIIVAKPLSNDTVTSPIIIEGQARGFWFFEADFPIELHDSNGNIIGSSLASAQSDWMTEDFVEFESKLEYNINADETGFLVFKKDNPSGIAEFDDLIIVPVHITATPATVINVFFSNNKLDPEISCNRAFPVARSVSQTEAIGKSAIEELLKGPSESDKNDGYFTNLNDGVVLQSLTIENQTAYADFNGALDENIGGSCRVSAIRAQIEETLKQFSSVQEVVISIDGETEEILQP